MIDEVNVIINGTEYQDFTDVQVTKSIETLAGTFRIATTSSALINFPIKVFSECQILVAGTQVINGYIEKLTISYTDGNAHDITVSGRDRTADIIDSTVKDKPSNYNPPITLKAFTERVLKAYNLSNIKVIEQTPIPEFKKNDSKLSGTLGESLFDYIQRYAHKRQVLMTTNGDGNIVFLRAPTQRYNTHLILSENAPATILEAKIDYDTSKMFNEYICHAQENPTSGGDDTQYSISTKKTSGIKSTSVKPVIDDEVRNSRIYTFEADSSTNEETIEKRAKWEANFRRSQMKKWSYTIQGFIAKDDKKIWEPGYLIRVIDDFANTDSILLISSVIYQQNLAQGTRTVLKLVNKDSFTLTVTKPEKEKEENKEGEQQYLSPSLQKIRKKIKDILTGS